MGTITWAGVYHLSAWTNPANGQNRSITFEYDATDTVWRQVSQTGADVPNQSAAHTICSREVRREGICMHKWWASIRGSSAFPLSFVLIGSFVGVLDWIGRVALLTDPPARLVDFVGSHVAWAQAILVIVGLVCS